MTTKDSVSLQPYVDVPCTCMATWVGLTVRDIGTSSRKFPMEEVQPQQSRRMCQRWSRIPRRQTHVKITYSADNSPSHRQKKDIVDSQFPFNKVFDIVNLHPFAFRSIEPEAIRTLDISELVEFHKRLLTRFSFTVSRQNECSLYNFQVDQPNAYGPEAEQAFPTRLSVFILWSPR